VVTPICYENNRWGGSQKKNSKKNDANKIDWRATGLAGIVEAASRWPRDGAENLINVLKKGGDTASNRFLTERDKTFCGPSELPLRGVAGGLQKKGNVYCRRG